LKIGSCEVIATGNLTRFPHGDVRKVLYYWSCATGTGPTQKAVFHVPKTVLWLMEVQFFKSSFVVKVPLFL